MKKLLPLLLLFAGCDFVPPQIFTQRAHWERANPPILEEQASRTRPPGTVLVGVIDSGVDYTHPLIKGHIDSFPLDVSERGRTRGIGWDVLGNDSFPFPILLDPKDGEDFPDFSGAFEHGTHVAQLVTLNNKGIRLFPIRALPPMKIDNDPCHPVLGDSLKCQISFVERAFAAVDSGVRRCREHGCQIINLSIGIRIRDLEVKNEPRVQQLLSEFEARFQTEWKDILFVVAAGNEGVALNEGIDSVPASLSAPNIISVGALDNSKFIAAYSNYDRFVDIHARGTQIKSAIPEAQMQKKDGTSMATPLVAHLAAELKLIDPTLSPEELRAIILNTADVKTLPVAADPDMPIKLFHSRNVLVMNAKYARTALKKSITTPHIRPILLNPPFPHGGNQ